METTSSTVVQGKYGFYPCSYGLYLKLKRLNYLCFLGKRRNAEWERWNRKLPHNRVIRQKKRNVAGQVIGYEIVGIRTEPIIAPCYDPDATIYYDYRAARSPVSTPEGCFGLHNSEAVIDRRLGEMEQWCAEFGPRRERKKT